MIKIISARGTGKTVQLVKMSAETGACIVCHEPSLVKHLNFSDFIKWCHGNADVPSYDITYNGSKHFISLLD